MRSLPNVSRTEVAAALAAFRFFVALACFAWSMVVSTAHAEEVPTILFLRSPEVEPRIVHRLRAEFSNLGIAVVEAPDEPTDDPSGGLFEAAGRARAFAAIRIVVSDRDTTVWIADRTTNKTLVRTLPPSSNPHQSEVVALEVVELLRASVLELNLPEAARERPPAPQIEALLPLVERSRPAPPPRTRAELAPTILLSPGGMGPTGQAGLGLRYAWTPALSTRGFLLLPVIPGVVSGAEGNAEIDAGLVGLDLQFEWAPTAGHWQLITGVGIAAAAIRVAGTTRSSLLAQVETVYAAVPIVEAALRVDFGSRFGAGARLLGGMSAPRPLILFGDRRVAYWGHPLLGAAATLDVNLD